MFEAILEIAIRRLWLSGCQMTPLDGGFVGIDPNSDLVIHLTESQNRLYAFILVLLPDPHAARDVLQETNLVIWDRADEYRTAKSFWAWASGIARKKVPTYFRDCGRDRLVFDDALVESLALVADHVSEEDELRGSKLRDCLEELPPDKRDLLSGRYVSKASISALAQQLGRSNAAVGMLLYRLREILANCIRRKLAEEEAR